MPKNLKRFYGQSHLHFITSNCYRRLPLLSTPESRTIFLNELHKVRTKYEFSLIGYVVMPTHVHLLMTEPKLATPSTALQILKQRSSHLLQNPPRTTPTPIAHLPQFWQPRFYDFNVYSHKKKIEKLHYIHANPVKSGLVAHPSDWPWSSFSTYAYDESPLLAADAINV
jgi:putative transposase